MISFSSYWMISFSSYWMVSFSSSFSFVAQPIQHARIHYLKWADFPSELSISKAGLGIS